MAPGLDHRRGHDEGEADHESDRVRADSEADRDPDREQQEAEARDRAEATRPGDLAPEEEQRRAAQAAEVHRFERRPGEQAHREARRREGERESRGARGEREVRSFDRIQPHLSPLGPSEPSLGGTCASNSRPSRTSRSTNAPKPSPRPTRTPQGSVAKRLSTPYPTPAPLTIAKTA